MYFLTLSSLLHPSIYLIIFILVILYLKGSLPHYIHIYNNNGDPHYYVGEECCDIIITQFAPCLAGRSDYVPATGLALWCYDIASIMEGGKELALYAS